VTVAYYVHDEKGKIDFSIFDNKANKIYTKAKSSRGYYEFNATSAGLYEFQLDNEKV